MFTPEKLAGLKDALKKAQSEGKSRHGVFIFDGQEYVVGYATYLIEYLESRLEPTEDSLHG